MTVAALMLAATAMPAFAFVRENVLALLFTAQ